MINSKGAIKLSTLIPTIVGIIAILGATVAGYSAYLNLLNVGKKNSVTLKEVSEKIDKIEKQLKKANKQLIRLLNIHEKELIEEASKTARATSLFKRSKKLPRNIGYLITAARVNTSPKKIFFVDRYNLNEEDINFIGESKNGTWNYDMSMIVFQGKKEGDENIDGLLSIVVDEKNYFFRAAC